MSDLPSSQGVIGRIAPSPTGGLHLGHARTFLLTWLAVRSAGGRLVLRIEDLDPTRTRPEAIQGAIEDLRWLGLDWDEGPDAGGSSGPYLQSERFSQYQAALELLMRRECVYPCTCTRSDLAHMASAPHATEERGRPARCPCAERSATEAKRLADRPYAWRFRVEAEEIAWDDLFQGRLTRRPDREGGDFVVARSGGLFAYQLAVVHDDAAMGITQVIRGDDLIPSTPRQLLLYRALGREPPRFGHVGLVLDGAGRRLAKRDGSLKLARLRERGVDRQGLLRSLARSLGLPDIPGAGDPASWLSRFDLHGVVTKPVSLSTLLPPPDS